ncbi:hypothetical protein H4R18_005118 [Coemansia javaensis]|uniref:G-protein coupled receptors family 3 profile domain-containing protein n=1 Tax=Coemansia javaensis TaxID=2761396 RepID=A0A9W8H7G2_9FUNG|nr:hypothetical protein H4R18_005118 [Coemansia javaensis]
MGNGLSFADPQAEQARVTAAAALLRKRLDPRGPADAILIIVLAAVYSVTSAAVVYMLFHRNYPPIRCKSPLLLAAIAVSSMIWFVGDLQSNGHLQLQGTVFTNCKAFGVWMRNVLGVFLVSGLWAVRAYGVLRVFRSSKPFHGRGMYIPLGIFLVYLVVYGIVTQLLSAARTMYYVRPLDICGLTTKILAVSMVTIWVIWSCVVVLSWMTRNIKTSFNETRETIFGCIVVFAVLIWANVTMYAAPYYPFSVRLRVMSTAVDHVATNSYLWLAMAKPVFNCMFRREQYLDRWVATLVEDGLELQYDVGYDEQNNITTMYQPSTEYLHPKTHPGGAPSCAATDALTISVVESSTTFTGKVITWPRLHSARPLPTVPGSAGGP